MRKIINIFMILALLVVSSCMDEMAPVEVMGEGEGWLLLDFNAKDGLEVSTKSTQSIVTESQVRNFYIFIFDKDGYKKYGQFFDKNNQKSTSTGVENAVEDCWWIDNASTDDPTTTGKVKVKLSEGSDYKVYMLANVDSDMVKISSDLLSNNINNEQDLLDFNVYLNQTTVYRNTYFPMSGKLTGVKVEGNKLTSNETSSGVTTLTLSRLDAKVKFVFKAGNREDNRGQTIFSFKPYKWKVVNVPRTAYAIGQDNDHCKVDPSTSTTIYSDYASYFFDSGFVNFEEYNTDGSAEFAFYMLENRQSPKKSLNKYQDRSKQVKDGDGCNVGCEVSYVVDGETVTKDMKVFEYANDFSTYVIVTGKVDMNLEDDDAGKVLSGEVQYIIHLGNWGATINSDGPEDAYDTYTNFDNFMTERNTSYTYTVTVNSVNNIRVEIESSKDGIPANVDEGQPGAIGSLTIAKEDIALCDAHYTSKTLNFHLCNFFEGGVIDKEHCIVDKMTWRVETPFNPDGGSPVNVGGIDIAEGLDYQWVTFRLNKPGTDGNYSELRRKYTTRIYAASSDLRTAAQNLEDDGTEGLAGYHNDGCMDVAALVQYMRTQVNLWLTNPEASDFDNTSATEDEIKNPESTSSPKISLTVFVDEYYYTEHPLTHSKDDIYLWKKFVNADDRKMQILCNSDASLDAESRSTGSVVTIQQKSIKCMYNTNESVIDLKTAWGLENEDEYDVKKWEYSTPRGATDDYNGLLNSCYEWNLISSMSTSTFETKSWSTYMNNEVDNDTPILNDGYKTLRYSCMARNRDNDGDGVIDRDEIRWYTASLKQLIGIYIGADVIHPDSRLYNRSAADQAGTTNWKQWVSSSTNGKYIYAEEGMAVGDDATKGESVRCVRNLGDLGGFIEDGGDPETYDFVTYEPQDYISVEEDPDESGSYIFTNKFINEESLRYYSSTELPLTDERAVENRLYKKFKTCPTIKSGDEAVLFWKFNQNVDEALAKNEEHPYCPKDYRVPNQRELAMMRYYTPSIITDLVSSQGILSRTKWYFGVQGDGTPSDAVYDKYYYSDYNYNKRTGFCIATWGDKNLSLGDNVQAVTTRCVKDIRED